MPTPTADASKSPQPPGSGGSERASSLPSKPEKKSGARGTFGNQKGSHRKSSSVSSNKRRGIATPASLTVLHRKGYILDGGSTLGTGAYAKVKVGTSLKMNIQVAIKVINKLSTPKEVVEKFLPREIETMRAVSNEHIIKLYEVVETPETLFFVMELADRGDLLDFINERKYLSERLARGFFSDLVKGMDHCHTRGVVHRDLKCENLLLDSHMRIKISDFGFARKFDGNLRTFCGSFAYAAPEVILGNPYNGPLADIWSMGIILYAMVTGRLPFKDTSTSVLMSDIAAGPKFSSRHTEKIKSLITRILTFVPQDRADMAFIQNHPWLSVSITTLQFPSTGGEKRVSSSSVNKDPKAGSKVEKSESQKSGNKSSGYVTGSNQGSVKKSQQSRIPIPTNKSSRKRKETLAVPVTKSGTQSGNSSPQIKIASLSTVLDSLQPKSRSSNTFPVNTGHRTSLFLDDQKKTGVSSKQKLRVETSSGISFMSGDPTSNSRILDNKHAFHSVSRYEKGGHLMYSGSAA